MHIETLNIQVRAVEEVLLAQQLDYVIAGGYPRDLFYGREPKDCDIWVLDSTKDVVLDLIEGLSKLVPVRAIPFYGALDADNPNVACIIGVIKAGNVDVIVCNDKAKTLLDLVDRFDCNINRFAILLGSPMYIDKEGGPVAAGPSEYIQQHTTNGARMAKMRRKWEEIQENL